MLKRGILFLGLLSLGGLFVQNSLAQPIPGFVCNSSSKECYFDLIQNEEGQLMFPGCDVRGADDVTELKQQNFTVISGALLRKRKAEDSAYDFCFKDVIVPTAIDSKEPEDVPVEKKEPEAWKSLYC